MLISGHSLAILWFILIDATNCNMQDGRILDDAFRLRSNEDWAAAWHQESHVRCRENIQRHLYWACEKDIYKVSRRSSRKDLKQVMGYPIIDLRKAKTLLRYRRGAVRSSISNECCSPVGCTWEEYAEYCPFNKRIRKYRS